MVFSSQIQMFRCSFLLNLIVKKWIIKKKVAITAVGLAQVKRDIHSSVSQGHKCKKEFFEMVLNAQLNRIIISYDALLNASYNGWW